GCCNYIMYPSIFTLVVAELVPLTGNGSGLMNMAIVGGAIIPVIQGAMADSIGIHHAFILPVICYLYILFYALRGSMPNSERYANSLINAWRRVAMLLAADIGGTKTDLAIFSVEGGPHSPLTQTQVHSADYPSLQALVTEFLKKVKTPVERACFDVAGPVIDGRVKITNLPWVMDEASLAKDLNLKSVR